MDDLKDILSTNDENPRNDELINYVEDNLTEEEKYLLEKKAMDSEFVNDALEGLQSLRDKRQLDEYVQQLNKGLQQQLASKRDRKNKRMPTQNLLIIIAILILLAICIFGFLFIYFYRTQS